MPGWRQSRWRATVRAEAACESSVPFARTPASWSTSVTFCRAGIRRSGSLLARRLERCAAGSRLSSLGVAALGSRVEGLSVRRAIANRFGRDPCHRSTPAPSYSPVSLGKALFSVSRSRWRCRSGRGLWEGAGHRVKNAQPRQRHEIVEMGQLLARRVASAARQPSRTLPPPDGTARFAK